MGFFLATTNKTVQYIPTPVHLHSHSNALHQGSPEEGRSPSWTFGNVDPADRNTMAASQFTMLLIIAIIQKFDGLNIFDKGFPRVSEMAITPHDCRDQIENAGAVLSTKSAVRYVYMLVDYLCACCEIGDYEN
jgi:hypothetical protein